MSIIVVEIDDTVGNDEVRRDYQFSLHGGMSQTCEFAAREEAKKYVELTKTYKG